MPGPQVNHVKDGINDRFDTSPVGGPPAPNVINYPKDDQLIADPNLKIGNGSWNVDAYWLAKLGSAPPAVLTGALLVSGLSLRTWRRLRREGA